MILPAHQSYFQRRGKTFGIASQKPANFLHISVAILSKKKLSLHRSK
jgi:hypothetical protein